MIYSLTFFEMLVKSLSTPLAGNGKKEAPAKVALFLLQGLSPFLRKGLLMKPKLTPLIFSTVFTTLLAKAGFVCVVLVHVIYYITED